MYEIENFQSHFIKRGNGKGVAVYFKEEFQFKSLVSKPEYQISKFGSEDEDVVCIYRSTTTNLDLQREFLEDIKSMIDRERRQIFFGDFNIEATGNIISREFKSWNFTQLVNFPTHKDGFFDFFGQDPVIQCGAETAGGALERPRFFAVNICLNCFKGQKLYKV